MAKPARALILKGGGIKGLAYVGALKELEKYYEFTWFVGTSAGAIAAALLGAGYNSRELQQILSETDFREFLDSPKYKWPVNLALRHGLHRGHTLTAWIGDLVAKKLRSPVRVLLKDLPHRVTIYASTTGRRALAFDSADPQAAATPVAHAVRCSVTIPFLFTPERRDGLRVLDGGLQNNFPVDAVLSAFGKADFIGLYLGPAVFKEPTGDPSLIGDILSIFLDAADQEQLRQYREHTVIIDPSPISTLDFHLGDEEKDYLLKAGRAAALEFLARRSLENGPSQDDSRVAVKEADRARENVVSARRKRRRRRLAQAAAIAAMVVALVLGAVYFASDDSQPLTNAELLASLEDCGTRRECMLCSGRGPCRRSASDFVANISARGIAFTVCPPEEQRIRAASAFLGRAGTDLLIGALRKASLPGKSLFSVETFDTTGDVELDARVRNAVAAVNGVFRRQTNHRFYCGPSAFAHLDSEHGTLLLGTHLLWSIDDGTPASEAVMHLIASHEISHVVQIKKGFVIAEGNRSQFSRMADLHADFMAGWFVARFLKTGNAPSPLYKDALHRAASFAHGAGSSEAVPYHGTADERLDAVNAGFGEREESDPDKVYESGREYLARRFKF